MPLGVNVSLELHVKVKKKHYPLESSIPIWVKWSLSHAQIGFPWGIESKYFPTSIPDLLT